MARITEAEAKKLGIKPAKPEAEAKRRSMNKWETAYSQVLDADHDVGSWEFEAIRLCIGAGGKGVRKAWYTPDFLVSPRIRATRPEIHEVKGRRHANTMVAFRSAAKQYGEFFRFILVEGGPGNWTFTEVY